MTIDKKKKAIICAAVAAYCAARAQVTKPRAAMAPSMNPWGLSARQETMQIASMIQRRFWHSGA